MVLESQQQVYVEVCTTGAQIDNDVFIELLTTASITRTATGVLVTV